jgi:hypothetical protein
LRELDDLELEGRRRAMKGVNNDTIIKTKKKVTKVFTKRLKLNVVLYDCKIETKKHGKIVDSTNKLFFYNIHDEFFFHNIRLKICLFVVIINSFLLEQNFFISFFVPTWIDNHILHKANSILNKDEFNFSSTPVFCLNHKIQYINKTKQNKTKHIKQ